MAAFLARFSKLEHFLAVLYRDQHKFTYLRLESIFVWRGIFSLIDQVTVVFESRKRIYFFGEGGAFCLAKRAMFPVYQPGFSIVGTCVIAFFSGGVLSVQTTKWRFVVVN